MHNPFLIGKSIYLRGLEDTDLSGEYFQWFNDQKNDIFTSHALWPNTLEKMKSFFDRVTQYKNDIVLAIIEKKTEKHIGNVALHDINWIHRRAEFAIIIGYKKAQNKGYGFEATCLLIEHAFKKLNIHRIGLGVNESNRAAIRLYEKAGFIVEGRFKDHFLRDGKYSAAVRMAILNK
ncbi:MAG: GNAT family N-acetyltransferase [Nitrospirae bacterium]|nr:GNAT family N-acetyltransferase [Nitrospirota bacterium]